MTPTVVILAGGRSERMGQDKAQIVWAGETLLVRTARIAREAGCPVLVVGRDRPSDWPWPETHFLRDDQTGQGPLAGLATALRTTNAPVLALACDMPLLTVLALQWLMRQDAGLHGVAVQNGPHFEPLFSRYQPAALPLMQQRLAAGQWSLHALIRAGEFRTVPVPPDIAAALVNVNTRADLAGIEPGRG